MSYNQKRKEELELEQKQHALLKFKELQETFDKKYIESLFEEGVKCGLLPNTMNQNMLYEYRGYVYQLRREKIPSNYIF